VALLAPGGFCMGMMFPAGMVLSREFTEHRAWFWSVNGATSVFASVLGMALSMEFGIAQAYWAGVACYFLCSLLVLRQTQFGVGLSVLTSHGLPKFGVRHPVAR
jgi:MFS family permease